MCISVDHGAGLEWYRRREIVYSWGRLGCYSGIGCGIGWSVVLGPLLGVVGTLCQNQLYVDYSCTKTAITTVFCGNFHGQEVAFYFVSSRAKRVSFVLGGEKVGAHVFLTPVYTLNVHTARVY